MLAELMLNVKSKLASHLEVRDIRIMLNTQLERSERTLGIMEKHAKFLTSPISSDAKSLYAAISRESRINSKDLYSSLVSGMKITHSRVDNLINLYSAQSQRVIISTDLGAMNANALHLAAICDFYEKTARALVLSASEMESAALRKTAASRELGVFVKRNFSKDRVRSLGSILNYNQKVKDQNIVKAIEEMDDVEVTKETLEAAQAMGGAKRLDPAGFNYLNIINPTFWAYVGIKSYSELRLLWLDLEKDELEMLEIRHQELAQLKQNGETDMATDKLITKLKDRIDVKRYDIKELEESLG